MKLAITACAVISILPVPVTAVGSIVFAMPREPGIVTTRLLASGKIEFHHPVDQTADLPEAQASLMIAGTDIEPLSTAVSAPARPIKPPPTTFRTDERAGNQAAVLCNRGLMHMQAGNLREAKTDLDQAMRLHPDYQRGFVLRGVLAARQGNQSEAVEFYNRAFRVGPGTAELHHSRALAFVKLKRNKEAFADFTKAIELNPNFEDAFLKRGLLYGRVGEFEKSVADNTRAIALNPDNPLAFHNRAAALSALGKPEEAKSDLQRAGILEKRSQRK